MKNRSLIIFAGLVIVIGLLLWWARSVNTATATFWPGTDVRCLQFGHQNLSLHIHQSLTILVDGEQEPIPANIGVTPSCMAEVHTHDTTGELHIESVVPNETFTLADFFAVRGTTLQRDGFTHTVIINGAVIDDIAAVALKDKDVIIVSYERTP